MCAQRRRAIAKVCGALAARGDIVVRVHLQERALGDVRRGASSPSVVAVLTAHTNALGAFWALDLNRCRGAVLCGITNARTGLAFHVHSTPAEAVLLAFDPMGQPNERHERHRHRQRRRPGLHAFDAYSPIEGTVCVRARRASSTSSIEPAKKNKLQNPRFFFQGAIFFTQAQQPSPLRGAECSRCTSGLSPKARGQANYERHSVHTRRGIVSRGALPGNRQGPRVLALVSAFVQGWSGSGRRGWRTTERGWMSSRAASAQSSS